MSTIVVYLIVFLFGLLVRDLAREAWGFWYGRKMNRELIEAEERMRGCDHASTTLVDVGDGPKTRKCIKCWALKLPMGPNGIERWHPNTVPPHKMQPRPR